MDLISSISGTAVAAITKDRRATVVDFLKKEVVVQIDLKRDTDTRVSFDRNENKFILGSWKEGIDCIELPSRERLWHSEISGYTYANIIEGSSELYVTGLKDDPNGCRILNLETGLLARYLQRCGDLLAKSNLRIGFDRIQKTLLIFDEAWELIGSPEWKCFGLWSFACDESGLIIISGPSGYAASFVASLETPIAEITPHEYFLRIETVCWNKKRKCFFAVVSEFEGKETRALVRLDHTLKSFEIIRQFPLSSREVICDDRYLVAESGFIFDLDSQSELETINWDNLLS